MTGDPLWNEIKVAINQPLNPTAFERCAQDMLRAVYPNLVPIVGGSDGGCDGWFQSTEGPYPLICTSGEDVLDNFRKSITKHLESRRGPPRCKIATCQELTTHRRENILKEAKIIGVTVEQIHDQEDFIGRLYENAHWRAELLGVTGAPPALSIFPPRIRQTDATLLVGREEDLAWLRAMDSDALVVGQPGSGKTHLHQFLATEANVLFAVTDDPTRLANAIRSQRPDVVVVDDAQIRPEWIDLLRRLRVEVDAQFHIHANCWPGDEVEIANRLSIGPPAVRRLELIPRKVMHELIQKLGIFGPDDLMFLLLDQAGGKPGLCAALVRSCFSDGVDRIWTGDAIADQLLDGSSVRPDVVDREVLARFALGGDEGVKESLVAKAMEMPLYELRRRIALLGAGGIVAGLTEHRVRVMPEPLRAVLVRNVFFRPLSPPELESALADCPDNVSATHVLISAKQRGAPILDSLIEERVGKEDNARLWEHFALMSEYAARVILDRRPDRVCAAAIGLLHQCPNEAIEALMRADEAVLDKSRQSTRDPYRLITEWISPWDAEDQVVARRSALVDALERAILVGRPFDSNTTLRFIGAVLDPSLQGMKSHVAERNTVIVRRGIHSDLTIRGIAAFWPRLCKLLPATTGKGLESLIDAVGNWAWPGRGSETVADAQATFMRDTAQGILRDLLVLPSCGRVMRSHIRWMDEHAKLGIGVHKDNLFDVIFSERDYSDSLESYQAEREKELTQIAESLLASGIERASQLLGEMESDVAVAGRMRGGWDRGRLYMVLAERTIEPVSWVRHLSNSNVPQSYVAPFLNRIRESQADHFVSTLGELLPQPAYSEIAIRAILEYPGSPPELVDRVIRELKSLGENDPYRFQYQRLPIDISQRLLTHPIPEIQKGAAMGEWHHAPDHKIRPAILALWKQVVTKIEPAHDSELLEVFAAHPDVGFEWARRRIAEGKYDLWRSKRALTAIPASLTFDRRRELLLLMNDRRRFEVDTFDALIGSDFDLARVWFIAQMDVDIKSLPLRRIPSTRWEKLASIAMDCGLTPEAIADEIGSWGESWSGSAAAHYQQYVVLYEKLLSHSDARFHAIGRRGLEWAKRHVEYNRNRELLDLI